MNRSRSSNVKKGTNDGPEGQRNGSNGFSDALSSAEEDVQKVEEYLSGRRESLGFLFTKYREDVYRIAYRYTGNVDDAMEITQEVFLKVMTKIDEYEKNARFFTWLYRIAVNRSIDFLRSRKRKQRLLHETSKRYEKRHSESPEKTVLNREDMSRLQKGLAALNEKYRTVLVLHSLQNLSYREIARILGCSKGTVMSRLYYARRKLEEIVGSL